MILFKVNKNSNSDFNHDVTFSENEQLVVTSYPAVDIIEDENKILLKAEVAGLKRDDIKIVVEKNSLILSGNKNLSMDPEKVHTSENFYGSFRRKFRLSDEIDQNSVTAKLEEGILTITFNKLNVTKEKIIEVN